MNGKSSLTQERLKEVLEYNPSTGTFVWLVESWENCPIGKSGFRGVTIKPRLPKPFIAQINGDHKKKIHLGCFKTAEEASAAYVAAAKVKNVSIKGTIAGSIHSTGRWRITVDYKEYKAHQLAWIYMTGEWPYLDVDHKDNNLLNNKWSNLRLATPSQNAANKRKQQNKTGFKGVHNVVGSKINPYSAYIEVNGNKKYLGCFSSPEKAHSAYIIAAIRYFGEYARGE